MYLNLHVIHVITLLYDVYEVMLLKYFDIILLLLLNKSAFTIIRLLKDSIYTIKSKRNSNDNINYHIVFIQIDLDIS